MFGYTFLSKILTIVIDFGKHIYVFEAEYELT